MTAIRPTAPAIRVAAKAAPARPVAPAKNAKAEGPVKTGGAIAGAAIGTAAGSAVGLGFALRFAKFGPVGVVLGAAAGLGAAGFIGGKGGAAIGKAIEDFKAGTFKFKPSAGQVAAGAAGAVGGAAVGATSALFVGLNFVMGTAPFWAGPLMAVLIGGGAILGAAGLASLVGKK